MISIVILIACVVFGEPETHELDELDIGRLGYTANYKDSVFLGYIKHIGSGNDFSTRYALVNLVTKKAVPLMAPSLQRLSLPVIIATDDGYLVVDKGARHNPRLYFFNQHGMATSSQSLGTYEGWEIDFNLVKITQHHPGHTALATIEYDQSRKILLVLINFKTKTVKPLHSIEYDPSQETYWVSRSGNILYCNNMTGEFLLLDHVNFSTKENILKKQPLLDKPSDRISGFLKRNDRKQYSRRLSTLYVSGDVLNIYKYNYLDENGNNLKKGSLVILQVGNNNAISSRKDLRLGFHKGLELVYSLENHTLAIQKTK